MSPVLRPKNWHGVGAARPALLRCCQTTALSYLCAQDVDPSQGDECGEAGGREGQDRAARAGRVLDLGLELKERCLGLGDASESSAQSC